MPLGVYIHLPFCLSRCGYCDFYSTVQPVPHGGYADAVLRELEQRRRHFGAGPLSSIYIGGGTPSLWQPAELKRVLSAVHGAFDAAEEGVEVTLEANPCTLSPRALADMGAAGVNRLSLGIQALDDASLSLLGRRHDAARATAAVRQARAAGFHRVSCDLLVGIPQQSVAVHKSGVQRLLELGPDHLSLYSLTLSPQSPLGRRGLRPAQDDQAAELLQLDRELLQDAGLVQYEVSNYARPGAQCRHNSDVWAAGPYLGLGAGACSMRTAGAANLRRRNPPLEPYLAGAPPERETVPAPKAAFEQTFLGLRTTRGVDRRAHLARFGWEPGAQAAEQLAMLQKSGMLTATARWIKPTARGIWFADELALRLSAS